VPLGFYSQSHGAVAFGFFHIETHLLLLQDRVFWCRDFCELVTDLARTKADSIFAARLAGWRMAGAKALGDLQGAIAGRRYVGFIGELYRRWPFPEDPGGFRQKPDGLAPPEEVAALAGRYGRPEQWEVSADPGRRELAIDSVVFDLQSAQALIDYVWRGGMPGWQRGRRPDYLLSAADTWRQSDNPFLQGMTLTPDKRGAMPVHP